MKKLLIITILILSFTSCKKDETENMCTGTVCVTNDLPSHQGTVSINFYIASDKTHSVLLKRFLAIGETSCSSDIGMDWYITKSRFVPGNYFWSASGPHTIGYHEGYCQIYNGQTTNVSVK